MKITLEYVAMLKVHGPPSGGTVELPAGATARDLLNQLAIPATHQATVVAYINDTRARVETTLSEGDRVFLAVPISGG
jgi:sulfur carrier protein ThiS